jgi:hypothetical protein
VTLDQLQRAQLVFFAHQEGIATGSLNVMKAICYVLRNRVKAGWHDANWMEVIEHADEVAGNEPSAHHRVDIFSRQFQMLLQAVDDIYYSASSDDVSELVKGALYFQFADRPIRPWFIEHIIRDPKNHPRTAQTGMLLLFT